MTSAPERHTCSRAGCRVEATTALEWRNPRIHTGERFKTWLACAEHTGELQEFLVARAFPVALRPLDASADRVR